MKGHISINRSTSNRDNPLPIRIELEDDSSGIQFLQVDISLETFAMAVTGHSYNECEYELMHKDLIGKQAQHKTEKILRPEGTDQWTVEQLRKLLLPFETDGWIGDAGDFQNWHKVIPGTRMYNIHFVRWIEKEPE